MQFSLSKTLFKKSKTLLTTDGFIQFETDYSFFNRFLFMIL